MRTIAFILCFTFLFSSCDRLFKDEELLLSKTPYLGDELRIDGYYYHFVSESNRTVIHFLYRNGIILWGGTYATTNINEAETEMVKLYSEVRNRKDSWGVFLVEDNKIQYEELVESPNGASLAIYRRSGYIENDTTIHFIESYYSGRKETKQINEVWHFKQFDNKPDSTNNFIT